MHRRLNSIDLLKGVAILMIYFVHAPQKITGLNPLFRQISYMGEMGCQLFFLLAGFCVSMSWHQRKPALGSFYKAKFISLAVPYYLIIPFYFILNGILRLLGLPIGFIQNASWIPFAENLFFVHGFMIAGHNNVVPGGWFIGVLFFFFLLFPAVNRILSYLYHKVKGWIWLLPGGMLLVNVYLLAPIERYVLRCLKWENIFDLSDILVNFPVFLMGCILWFTHSDILSFLQKRKYVLYLFGAGGLLSAYHDYYQDSFVGKQFSWGVFWVACFFMAALAEDTLANGILGRILIRFGMRSYVLFFVHVVFAWYLIPGVIKMLNEAVTMDVTVPYLILWVALLPVIYVCGCCYEKLTRMIMNTLRL